jgi:hypothetical protein
MNYSRCIVATAGTVTRIDSKEIQPIVLWGTSEFTNIIDWWQHSGRARTTNVQAITILFKHKSLILKYDESHLMNIFWAIEESNKATQCWSVIEAYNCVEKNVLILPPRKRKSWKAVQTSRARDDLPNLVYKEEPDSSYLETPNTSQAGTLLLISWAGMPMLSWAGTSVEKGLWAWSPDFG